MVKIYKCILTDKVMFADSFKREQVFDGYITKIKSKYIYVNDSDDVVHEDDADETCERVLDIEKYYYLQKNQFKKKAFITYVQGYLGSLVKKLEEEGTPKDEIEKFKTGVGVFFKKVLTNFKEYDYYLNEDNDIKGACAFALWEGSDPAPTFYFVTRGFKEEKC